MEALRDILRQGHERIVERLGAYAAGNGYQEAVPVVEFAVKGLSSALAAAAESGAEPLAAYAVAQSVAHRGRGLGIGDYIGLLILFRQAYLDLIRESTLPSESKEHHRAFLVSAFDRLEVLACSAWVGELGTDGARSATAPAGQAGEPQLPAAQDMTFLIDIDDAGWPTKFSEVSDAACRVLGYGREELLALTPVDLAGGAVLPTLLNHVASQIHDHGQAVFEWVMTTKAGVRFPVQISAYRMVIWGRKCYLAVARGISERRFIEAQLSEANRRLAEIIEHLPDATFVVDQGHHIIAWNRAMEELTGVSKQAVLGHAGAFAEPLHSSLSACMADIIGVENPPGYFNIRREHNVVYAETFSSQLRGGRGAHLALTASRLYDSTGAQVGAIQTVRDITDRKLMEARLQYLSLHDTLTGLYSRSCFEESLAQIDETSEELSCVIICDVDGLKLVNDSLGHSTGDALLKAAASVIRGRFRDDDMVARIGGDEFAVLLSDCPDRDTAQAFCDRIRTAAQEYNAANPGLPLSISIGHAAAAHTSGSDLFEAADNDMYREKLHRSQSARGAIVQALMSTLEARDIITGHHSERVEALASALGEAIGLSERSLSELSLLARFHDIGKVGVPDHILMKPAALTPEERAEVQRHCEIGHRIALATADLVPIAEWILRHHEWWDGNGYPLGLRHDEIPLECRIIAIVDAYDAMTNDRPHRRAMPPKHALAELRRCAGTQFDPALVEQFMAVTSGAAEMGVAED